MKNNKLALFGGRPALTGKWRDYNSIGKEEAAAVNRVIRKQTLSGFLGRHERFLGGPEVQKLEKSFCKYFKMKHAVSFNSATTALQAAVAALGIGPGDQVITSPFTMSATPSAVLFNNAVPVFADVDEKTFCISAETIAKKITPQTKAILVVNLLGGAADYEPILKLAKKHNLKIIEDSAQAPGATYRGRYAGTIGDIGVFSFNVHKVIQSGEGGMLITNNDRYVYRAQLLRNHGEVVVDDRARDYAGQYGEELMAGNNFRLTELQAAIVSEQFKKLDKLNNYRIKLADQLTKGLNKFNWLTPVSVLPESKHVYYLYPIKFNALKAGFSRQTFVEAITKEGFRMGQGYQRPIYHFPIYQRKRIFERSQFPFVSGEYPQNIDYPLGMCPVVERLYEKEMLTTTLCQPPKTEKTVDEFLRALEKIEANREALREYEKKKRAI